MGFETAQSAGLSGIGQRLRQGKAGRGQHGGGVQKSRHVVTAGTQPAAHAGQNGRETGVPQARRDTLLGRRSTLPPPHTARRTRDEGCVVWLALPDAGSTGGESGYAPTPTRQPLGDLSVTGCRAPGPLRGGGDLDRIGPGGP